jgi:hypothetical protein
MLVRIDMSREVLVIAMLYMNLLDLTARNQGVLDNPDPRFRNALPNGRNHQELVK